jgi:hypothetical protein
VYGFSFFPCFAFILFDSFAVSMILSTFYEEVQAGKESSGTDSAVTLAVITALAKVLQLSTGMH